MQRFSSRFTLLGKILFVVLGLYLSTPVAHADGVVSEGRWFYWFDNDSIYGRENGPITNGYRTFAPSFSITGASTSWALDQFPRLRDTLYNNGYGGPIEGIGFSYLTMTEQDDGNGIEDSTWLTAWCDGPFNSSTRILGDLNYRKCWNMFGYSNNGGYSSRRATLTQYGSPANSIGNQGLSHFPVNFEDPYHGGNWELLGWYQPYMNTRNASTGAFSFPSTVIAESLSGGGYDNFHYYSVVHPELWNPHYTSYGLGTTNQLGYTSPLGDLRISQHICTPKNVCVNSTTLDYRDENCDYHFVSNCTICGNGVCNPPVIQTPALAIPKQITPVTVSDAIGGPTILSSPGLQQCIPFQKHASLADPDIEEYFVDEPYQASIYIPPSLSDGYAGLLQWTAFDNAYANQTNQLGLNWPYYQHEPFNYISLERGGSIYYLLKYNGQFWDENTRILKAPLFPTSEDLYDAFGWRFMVTFKNETEAETNWYGAFGRGDSFVTQFQPHYSAISSIYYDGDNWSAPNQIGYPLIFHYTLPTYAQCAPPAEVVPSVQRTNMSCSDTSNTISWSPVAGADQYRVLVRSMDVRSVNTWDYLSWDNPYVEYGEVTATTTSTSYTWTAPTSGFLGPSHVGPKNWQVRVYAHNSKGWNISNSPVFFTVANCTTSCVGPDGATLVNGQSRTYYASTTGSCVGQNRLCTNGVLSGTNAYTHSTCNRTCVGPDGSTLQGWEGYSYFNSTTAPCVSQYRYCDANTGLMSGDSSYSHLTCVNEYCVGPDGSKIAVNETKRYWSDVDPGTCEYTSTDLLCYPDGTLDWWSYWYPYPSCPANPGTCSVDGVTMQDGETQRFFESTDPCTPAFLTCNGAGGNVTGGTVGKTYTQNNSCVVDTSCHSPDGITTPNGGIRTFFESSTPPCVSVNRQCVNGTFSPSTPTETSCGTSINAIGRFYASPAIIKKGGTTTLFGTAVAATGGCTITGVNINPSGP